MQKPLYFPYLCLFLLTFCLFSCNRKSEAARTEQPKSGLSPQEQAELECLSKGDRICESGLSFAQLNDTLAAITLPDMDPEAMQDSSISRGGYTWLTRTVHLNVGRVVLEGAFFDDRQVNDTLLSASLINRIRIESPLLSTTGGIHTGNRVSDLEEILGKKDWLIQAVPGYGVLQIQVGDSRISYLIPQGTIKNESDGTINRRKLPPDAEIIALVVM